MIFGLFSTPFDSPYLARLRPIIGTHALKVAHTPHEFLSAIAAKCRVLDLDAIICTCPETMVTLLNTQPEFKHPVNKNGHKRKLSLDDYAGSCFTIPSTKLGTTKDVKVLILNPLAQLVSTDTGEFITKRFISKLLKPSDWFPQTNFSFEIWTPEKHTSLLYRFREAKLLALDIETYVGDADRRIHCVGYCGLFADGSTHSVVVPFKDMLAHSFVRSLNSSSIPKLMQGGGYDNLYLMRWNVVCENYLFDTMTMFHCWYSELPKRLDFVTAFMIRDIRFWKDDASAGTEYDLFEYNARDCWATMMAWLALLQEVPKYALNNYHIEFPLIFPCLHIEADGITVDKSVFEQAQEQARASLEGQAAKLRTWIGPKFNPNSSQQCVRLLQVLGIKNATAAGKSELTAASAVHPLNALIIGAILAYRKQAKLLSTYFVWDKFWNGRLYYRTNPAGTDTGRLASTESSFWCGLQIQNIPQGKAVKSWLVADAGWKLAETDYAQSEARCVGYISGCKTLIDLVESDKDFHKFNASAFFGVPYDEITKDLRNLAKRVNHGANYGMGAGVMLETMGPVMVADAKTLLKLPAKWSLVQVCQHLLLAFERTYPEVKITWVEAIKREIKLTKKMVSPLGWTRYFFSDPTKSKHALNAAIAHAPQNLSVSIINKVFYQIWRDTVYGDLRGEVRLKAQIHDSILYQYRHEDSPAKVAAKMQYPITVQDINKKSRTLLIPSDTNSGETSWGNLK